MHCIICNPTVKTRALNIIKKYYLYAFYVVCYTVISYKETCHNENHFAFISLTSSECRIASS